MLKKKKKKVVLDLPSDSDDSDSEWTPALEATPRSKTFKKLNQLFDVLNVSLYCVNSWREKEDKNELFDMLNVLLA